MEGRSDGAAAAFHGCRTGRSVNGPKAHAWAFV
jgi:hypothetical protein